MNALRAHGKATSSPTSEGAAGRDTSVGDGIPSSTTDLERALSSLLRHVRAAAPERLPPGLDHPALVALGPAFRVLLEDHDGLFDEAGRDWLRSFFVQTAVDNLTHQDSLKQVLAALGRAGIEALVVKGIVFSETLYPSLGARRSRDLDLLVRDGDVAEASRILRGLGYRAETDALTPDGQVDLVTKSICLFWQAEPASPGHPPSTVDLHWNLFNVALFRRGAQGSFDDLRGRSVPVRIGSSQVLTLGVEDTFLHLAYHQAVKHHLLALKGFLDLDLLCRRHSGRLVGLPEQARNAGLQHALFHALDWTRELFGTPIPDAVLEALRPARLRLWLVRRLVRPEWVLEGRKLRFGVAEGLLLDLLLVDRARDLPRLLWRAIWPEPAWLEKRLERAGAATSHPRLWHLRRCGFYLAQLLSSRSREAAARAVPAGVSGRDGNARRE